MIFPAKMKELNAIIPSHLSDVIVGELLNLGVMHFIKINQLPFKIEDGVLDEGVKERDYKAYTEVRKRFELFADMAGLGNRLIPVPFNINEGPANLSELNGFLDQLTNDIKNIREDQKSLQDEILRLEEMIDRLLVSEKSHSAGDALLTFKAGRIRKAHRPFLERKMQGVPFTSFTLEELEEFEDIFIVFLKRDKSQIEQILDEISFTELDNSPNMEIARNNALFNTREKVKRLKDQQNELKEKSVKIIFDKEKELIAFWQKAKSGELFTKIQSYSSHTSRTVLFSGWIPENMAEKTETAIQEAGNGNVYIEWHSPTEIEKKAHQDNKPLSIPVKFENPAILSPFQMLVTNFSIPEYGTIDPTAFVGIAYVSMFGLMFADTGQGIVVILLSLLAKRVFKYSESWHNLFNLMIWCGSASVVAGLMFGSVFGMPLLEPLWFDFHAAVVGHGGEGSRDVYSILKISIYFGITVIYVGIILNMVNCVAKKKWLKLIFDKGGLIGGFVYGAGIYTAFYFASTGYKSLPDSSFLVCFFGIPALFLGFKPLVEYLEHRKHKPYNKPGIFIIATIIMEWLLELLEIVMGYLTNTLSFMRVAGLGIAHVSLMMAFFQMANMAGTDDHFGPVSIIILILGNGMVIVLEGLSAGIQSLRLNYYEFFSKYFVGTGRAYDPVSLLSKKERG